MQATGLGTLGLICGGKHVLDEVVRTNCAPDRFSELSVGPRSFTGLD